MSEPSLTLTSIRRYVLLGLVLLLHVALYLALSHLIVFKAPVVADVFESVKLPNKPVASQPPPPPPPPPQNLISPSESVAAAAPQAIPTFNPTVAIPQVDTTRLPMPSMPMASPAPSVSANAGTGTGLTGTEGQGSATGDIGVLGNALKGGTPADTVGYVAFNQATLSTADAVDKIEAGYPNVSWDLSFPATVDIASVKSDPVTGRTKILDNLQCLVSGDATTATLAGAVYGLKRVHIKNLVIILDLTDPSNRNEHFAKDFVKYLRDNSIRLFIIPMSANGADIAIHGSVYQCLSSYVTESGGVIYFPNGVPKDNDNPDPQL